MLIIDYKAKHLKNPFTAPNIMLCTQLFLCLQCAVLEFSNGHKSIFLNLLSIRDIRS